MKTVYISGGMSGYPDHNFPLFNLVANQLKHDYRVLNPAKNPDGLNRYEYLRLDAAHILDSDFVVCLPGWELSQGASLEVFLAHEIGLPIYAYIPPAGLSAYQGWRSSVVAGRFQRIRLDTTKMLVGTGYSLTKETL